MRRCYYQKDSAYRLYGARGVTVCERWHKFENFYADMGDSPEGLSIDRIDTFGNYEPDNCRWADGSTQARNKRNQRRLIHNGRNMHVEDWEMLTGIDHEIIWLRIHKLKWDVERALSEPIRRQGKKPYRKPRAV